MKNLKTQINNLYTISYFFILRNLQIIILIIQAIIVLILLYYSIQSGFGTAHADSSPEAESTPESQSSLGSQDATYIGRNVSEVPSEIPSLDSSGPSSNNTTDEEIETITSDLKQIIYDVNKDSNLTDREKSALIITKAKEMVEEEFPDLAKRDEFWGSYRETVKDRLDNLNLYFKQDWKIYDAEWESAPSTPLESVDQNAHTGDRIAESADQNAVSGNQNVESADQNADSEKKKETEAKAELEYKQLDNLAKRKYADSSDSESEAATKKTKSE